MPEKLNDIGLHLVRHTAKQIRYSPFGGNFTVKDALDSLGFDGIYIDHSDLVGLTEAADHPQYSTIDGTRAFTGPVYGVYPTNDGHLATRGYIIDRIHEHETAYEHDDIYLNTQHRAIVSGNPHNVLAIEITDFDTEVANNPSVIANIIARHERLHGIDSIFDHEGVSGATEDNIIVFDGNGLPKDNNVPVSSVVANTAHSNTVTGNPHQLDYDDIINEGSIECGTFI